MARGLPQKKLGEQVYCHKAHISKIEHGRQLGSQALAEALDRYFGSKGRLLDLWLLARPGTDDVPSIGAPCPYPGLAPYAPEHARWFRGRDAAVSGLLAELDGRLTRGGPHLVVAPSGAGKSSLLYAGLVPALREGRLGGTRDWTVVRFTPGERPLTRLARELAAVAGTEPDAVHEQLRDAPERCADDLRTAGPGGQPFRTAVVVDQLEEIFTLCTDVAERAAFLDALSVLSTAEAERPAAALVVAGLRADFFGRCLAHPGLTRALRTGAYLLEPMTEAELRAAIVEPAEDAGLEVEDALVRTLLAHLGTLNGPWAAEQGRSPGALPLLAHALQETWRHREGDRLTLDGYLRAGGVKEALARTAETTYLRLDPRQQRIAAYAFVRLAQLGEADSGTRRRIARPRLIAQLPGSDREAFDVIEEFTRARLLTIGHDPDGEASVEIAHEALLGAWERLRQWVTQEQLMRKSGRDLAGAADRWAQSGRDPEELLRDRGLATLRDWANRHPDELGRVQREFLAASVQRAERRIWRRRLRWLLSLGSVMLLVVSGTTMTTYLLGKQQQAEHTAVAQRLANQAMALAGSAPSLSARLAVAAFRKEASADSRSALLSSVQPVWSERRVEAGTPVAALAGSGDGSAVAWGGEDGTIRWWNPRTDPHARSTHERSAPSGAEGRLVSLSWSADGKLLAAAWKDGDVWLYDRSWKPQRLRAGHQNLHHEDTDMRVAFAPSGRRLFTAGGDGVVRSWLPPYEEADWEHRPGGQDAPGPVRALAVSPADGTLAVGGGRNKDDDGTERRVALLDPSDGSESERLADRPGGPVRALRFSTDGRKLVGGSFDDSVQVWDLRTGGARPLAPDHGDSVMDVAVAADGTVVTAGQDNTAMVRDLSGTRVPLPITGHTGPVNALAVIRDGSTLITGSEDGQLMVWHLADSPVRTGTAPMTALARAPRSDLYAVGDTKGRVALWGAEGNSPRRSFHAADDEITSLAFSGDGRRLAVAGKDRTVTVWNTRDGTQSGSTLRGHEREVLAVTFTPDGNKVISGGWDDTIRIWDLPSSRQTVMRVRAPDIWALALSPGAGEPLLASAGQDNMVTLRTWPGGRLRERPRESTDSIFDLAYSRDGELLASAGRDHIVEIWHTRRREKVSRLYGHTGPVVSVDFSANGRSLVTASRDGTVRIWRHRDDGTWGPYAQLTGHTGKVRGAAFALDDRVVVSVGEDGTLRRWGLGTESAEARICAGVGPGTAGEWRSLTAQSADSRPCTGA